MLLYGMKDDRVSMEETESIFKNLADPKDLKLYPDAGHESYYHFPLPSYVIQSTSSSYGFRGFSIEFGLVTTDHSLVCQKLRR
jgi:hypothetical protein